MPENGSNSHGFLSKVEVALRAGKELILLGVTIIVVFLALQLLPTIRERLETSEITELSLGPISLKLQEPVSQFSTAGISVSEVGGESFMVEKGSQELLHEIRDKLRRTGGQRIAVLNIVPGKRYSGRLLRDYIATLGVRFVIFQVGERFDGYIDAGLFAGQLLPETIYEYEELRNETVGVSTVTIGASSPAEDALEQMRTMHMDYLPVVDEESGTFRFMVSQQEILGRIVTEMVLAKEEQTGR